MPKMKSADSGQYLKSEEAAKADPTTVYQEKVKKRHRFTIRYTDGTESTGNVKPGTIVIDEGKIVSEIEIT